MSKRKHCMIWRQETQESGDLEALKTSVEKHVGSCNQ